MVSTPLKNISQIGNLPQIGLKIKNIWNDHLEDYFTFGILSPILSPITAISNFPGEPCGIQDWPTKKSAQMNWISAICSPYYFPLQCRLQHPFGEQSRLPLFLEQLLHHPPCMEGQGLHWEAIWEQILKSLQSHQICYESWNLRVQYMFNLLAASGMFKVLTLVSGTKTGF